MKRKKNLPENPNTALIEKKSGRLRRYRERLEKESREQEKRMELVFRRRVTQASDKKAIKTLRTKAYYRFSKSYPSVVSPDGFRENITEKERLSLFSKIVIALLCAMVFASAFVLTDLGMLLSATDKSENIQPVDSDESGLCVYAISPYDFAQKSAGEIKDEITAAGYNCVLVEFKSEYGYVYFDVDSFIGSSADKKISGAAEKIKELSDSGIKCMAYISCFKDSAASSALAGMEVLTSDGSLFKDSTEAMWLDPYNIATIEYITGLIKKAEAMEFSAIMLDNVCFPCEFYMSAPVYLSYVEGKTKKDVISEFINEVVSITEKEIILCCDITAFSEISALPNEKYGGTLLDTKCVSFCLDMRDGKQYNVHLENSESFRYVEEMPPVFILDAGTLAVTELGKQKEAYFLYAFVDKSMEQTIAYVEFSGIKNFISADNK